MGALKPKPLLSGHGLRPLLKTEDFGAWEQLVGSALGHHRSRLLPGSQPFEAHIESGAVAEFSVLLLQGCGRVELLREQGGHGVLWLPLQGLSHETINGQEYLAEPGMGLLFRPGDQMRGLTSEELAGVSILLPPHSLPQHSGSAAAPLLPLLSGGAAACRLIKAGWQLAEAAACQPKGASFAAEILVDALQQWVDGLSLEDGCARLSVRRRCSTVADACRWIEEHLAERFSVVDLSQALQVSVRSLQYSFQAELGCTPMAQAKRLRLRHLRQLLLNRDLADRSIADLMAASGLLACGATAADYRRWCGETPRRTRQHHAS